MRCTGYREVHVSTMTTPSAYERFADTMNERRTSALCRARALARRMSAVGEPHSCDGYRELALEVHELIEMLRESEAALRSATDALVDARLDQEGDAARFHRIFDLTPTPYFRLDRGRHHPRAERRCLRARRPAVQRGDREAPTVLRRAG